MWRWNMQGPRSRPLRSASHHFAKPGIEHYRSLRSTLEGGWVTIGTINYKADDLKYFNSFLRHRFDVTKNGLPIPATGIRIKVPNNQTDIDEIEVNGNLAIEQQVVRITNGLGFTISWDGNNGQFND